MNARLMNLLDLDDDSDNFEPIPKRKRFDDETQSHRNTKKRKSHRPDICEVCKHPMSKHEFDGNPDHNLGISCPI